MHIRKRVDYALRVLNVEHKKSVVICFERVKKNTRFNSFLFVGSESTEHPAKIILKATTGIFGL